MIDSCTWHCSRTHLTQWNTANCQKKLFQERNSWFPACIQLWGHVVSRAPWSFTVAVDLIVLQNGKLMMFKSFAHFAYGLENFSDMVTHLTWCLKSMQTWLTHSNWWRQIGLSTQMFQSCKHWVVSSSEKHRWSWAPWWLSTSNAECLLLIVQLSRRGANHSAAI